MGGRKPNLPNFPRACLTARVGDPASGEGAAVMGTPGEILPAAGHAEKAHY